MAVIDNLSEQTENIRKWQAACGKLSYLKSAGFREGDGVYDETRATIRYLQHELHEMQKAP